MFKKIFLLVVACSILLFASEKPYTGVKYTGVLAKPSTYKYREITTNSYTAPKFDIKQKSAMLNEYILKAKDDESLKESILEKFYGKKIDKNFDLNAYLEYISFADKEDMIVRQVFFVNTIKLAEKRGADVNKVDKNGNTPLINAVLIKDYPSFYIKALSTTKADASIENKDGETAIIILTKKYLTFKYYNDDTIETPLRAFNFESSDPKHKDKNGKSAFDYYMEALKSGQKFPYGDYSLVPLSEMLSANKK